MAGKRNDQLNNVKIVCVCVWGGKNLRQGRVGVAGLDTVRESAAARL